HERRHEEAGGLFVRFTYGDGDAWRLRCKPERGQWRDCSDGQPWDIDERTVFDCWCALRTQAHEADFGVRRAFERRSCICDGLSDYDAVVYRVAAAQRIHRRVSDSKRRL